VKVSPSCNIRSPLKGHPQSRPVFLLAAFFLGILLAACTSFGPSAYDPSINLDEQTQALVARASRTIFLIPFSHWDTDWHADFSVYSHQADQNILAAIRLAKSNPSYRYTLEQVLFVQHFWETHPEERADLKDLVQARQITFAWAGITQPETSLAAPGVQWHNLLQGRAWISATFGAQAVPVTAWQSDAFGNSAALPAFLQSTGLPYLYIGRWQNRCDPDYQNCQPLPPAFYWQSPLPVPGGGSSSRVLVTYLSYPTAWAALLNKNSPDQQLAALQTLIDAQFQRTSARYLFLPFGFDFLDPSPTLPDLVDRWNAAHPDTALVFADPETAFRYLATQDLPTMPVDLNPLWQAFYGTRPAAKIADKESEFYLTAADKFGLLLDAAPPSAWQTATINAHYDNISAVGYDSVWASSQGPRFAQAVQASAGELASRLAGVASRVTPPAPLLVFNSLSWPRGGVLEIHGDLPNAAGLPAPQQATGPGSLAFLVPTVPPIGYAAVNPGQVAVEHPAQAFQGSGRITLSNGLVSVTLDAAHGGAFSELSLMGETPGELLNGYGDDLVFQADNGDVYGATFGAELARQSQVSARLVLLAQGPLLARAQASFSLDGQPITKTITLRADSPLVEVSLQVHALPQTSALLEIPTNLKAQSRTDDLGFADFQHSVDARPIQPGDRTYRREIFYPVTYWSDVSSGGRGLSLITHGLQGVGGINNLTLLLARSVSDNGQEGVNDIQHYTLLYAYYPHLGDAGRAQPWLQAYSFNQPLIPVWRVSDMFHIQLPFQESARVQPPAPGSPALPPSFGLASSEGGPIIDLAPQDGQLHALVVNYGEVPASLHTSAGTLALPASGLSDVTIQLK
jgi:Glycosyl hydrolases family 38 N-terminal domain/Glycosyl hydrolases family 38 C-terminal domain